VSNFPRVNTGSYIDDPDFLDVLSCLTVLSAILLKVTVDLVRRIVVPETSVDKSTFGLTKAVERKIGWRRSRCSGSIADSAREACGAFNGAKEGRLGAKALAIEFYSENGAVKLSASQTTWTSIYLCIRTSSPGFSIKIDSLS